MSLSFEARGIHEDGIGWDIVEDVGVVAILVCRATILRTAPFTWRCAASAGSR